MNCERYDGLLNDYVDGLRHPEFERHLATCARCQALVADFTRIRQTASTLEEHVPPPRLWAKISSAIEEKPRRFSAWIPLAVAASLSLVIATATWLAWRHSPVETPQQAGAIPADAHYEQAIADLQQAAEAQNAALDPMTREVLQRNLAVIDRAIDESRAALADEPASTAAQESLMDALDTKVALLQDAVELNQ